MAAGAPGQATRRMKRPLRHDLFFPAPASARLHGAAWQPAGRPARSAGSSCAPGSWHRWRPSCCWCRAPAWKHWLEISLADEAALGIFAATRAELPSAFLWQVYRQLLGVDQVPTHALR
jgi:hypothetical protein